MHCFFKLTSNRNSSNVRYFQEKYGSFYLPLDISKIKIKEPETFKSKKLQIKHCPLSYF